jgi:ubiquinone biosynthesis UbiH/UbiF/VisC/COQ6 family hydroxylase
MKPAVFDVCVSGSGAVARALALALSVQGWRVALASEPGSLAPREHDIRTYALNARSIEVLERLRIWPALKQFATPVHEMCVKGDRGGELRFTAWQQCVSELAWIVDAGALERLLGDAIRYAPHVTQIESTEGQAPAVQASLLAVCEGKHSSTREALGASFDRQPYGHWGVAARLRASRPHAGVARQWFRSPDVLALLPFQDPEPGASYGLVWSMPQAQAQQWLAEPAEVFEAGLMKAIADSDPAGAAQVGELRLHGAPAAWPLAVAQASPWSGPGWVLLGDAAHQVHPLAGQGLNLGLADVDVLSKVLREAREREPWRSAGDERLLRRYERARWLPTRAMAGLTDGLLHLFETDQGLVRELRNTGMGLLNQWSPVKRWLVGQALDR